MTAHDNLNSDQFPSMSIEDIKRLPSIDGARYGGSGTVADTLPSKRDEIYGSHAAEYGQLSEHMRNAGQTAPVGITESGVFMQGHHRVAIAEDLGWKSLRYSHDVMQTDDDAWNEKHGDFWQ